MPRDPEEMALLRAINRLRRFTIEEVAAYADVDPAAVEHYLGRTGWAEPLVDVDKNGDVKPGRSWRMIPNRVTALIDELSHAASEPSLGDDADADEEEPFDDMQMLRSTLDALEGDGLPADQFERDLRMAQLYLKSTEVDLMDRQVASDRRLSYRQQAIVRERTRLRSLLPDTEALAGVRFGTGTQEAIRRALIDWSLPVPIDLDVDETFLDPIDLSGPGAEVGKLFKAVNGRLGSDLSVALWPALRALRLRAAVSRSTWSELRPAAMESARQNLQLQWASSLIAPTCVLAVVLEAVELAGDIFRALQASNALGTMDRFSRQLCLASLARLAHMAVQNEDSSSNTAAAACLFFAAQESLVEDLPLVIPAALCIEVSDARILMVKIARNVFSASGIRRECQDSVDEGAFMRTLGVAMFLRERFDHVGPHINELLRSPTGAALVYMLIRKEHGAVRVRPGDQQIWLQPDGNIKRRYPDLARVRVDTSATAPEVNERLQAQVQSRSWESFEVGSLTGMLEEAH